MPNSPMTAAKSAPDFNPNWTPAAALARKPYRPLPVKKLKQEPVALPPSKKMVRIDANGVMTHWLEMIEKEAESVAPEPAPPEPVWLDEIERTRIRREQEAEIGRTFIQDIIHTICTVERIRKKEFLSARRFRCLVRPRQVGMFLARQHTKRSFPEIGQKFGNRDHTTVMHAVSKVEELLESQDRTVTGLVRRVEHLLNIPESSRSTPLVKAPKG